VNRTYTSLTELGYVADGVLTEAGYAALEPYRVKRAVFIAAGFGSRLVPITLNTPKPLVRVKGTRMIDTLLDAVIAAGIEEIYIVRGYLGEQFDQLLYKYPMIRFIENPMYNEANNISSAMRVLDLFQNAYVMEADLLINNPAIFRKYHYTSNCLGVPVEKTSDWCVISENGVAKQLVQGGENCHHLFSIYYWTQEDGAKLPRQLGQMYATPGGKDRFWDLAPMNEFNAEHHIEIRECTFADITEIDTYQELQQIDSDYL
jgi:CTP:phosphocholine cytidylyltransferase-like protein